MSAIETRLKELDVVLPTPTAPVANFVSYTIRDRTVFISGQIPILNGSLHYVGKLGGDITIEAGQAAARLCVVNVLSQLKAACAGDLDRVTRCLRLGVYINATPDFTSHPEVANGASDLVTAVFREPGRHARAAVGVGSLPRGVAVEVDAIFEIA